MYSVCMYVWMYVLYVCMYVFIYLAVQVAGCLICIYDNAMNTYIQYTGMPDVDIPKCYVHVYDAF